MVCLSCGSPVAGPGTFCSKCGLPVAATGSSAPPYGIAPQRMFQPRVERHLQTLGILWCVYGAYRLLGGLAGVFFLKLMALHRFDGFGLGDGWPGGFTHGWLGALVPVVAGFTVVVTALAFLVGFGLLRRKPWGRTLAIVAGILVLIRPVLGLGLGIYTLWVLAPGTSAVEYDAISDRS